MIYAKSFISWIASCAACIEFEQRVNKPIYASFDI
jgi:hypothetical protein